MPLSCNVNINLNNLRGSLETNLSSILSLNAGTPAGLAAVVAAVGTTFDEVGAGIANAIDEVVPDISLRDELNTIGELLETPIAAAAKAAQLVGDFAEATGLDGFVNLDLTDLSNSVFSLNTSFDPCNPSIPNIFRSADGTLSSKPSITPNLGSDTLAVPNVIKQPVTDNVVEATENNQFLTDNVFRSSSSPINPQDFVTTQENVIQSNVSPAKSGMGDTLRRTETGETTLETTSSFISRVRANSSLLTEV
jgi:hypothetical protein